MDARGERGLRQALERMYHEANKDWLQALELKRKNKESRRLSAVPSQPKPERSPQPEPSARKKWELSARESKELRSALERTRQPALLLQPQRVLSEDERREVRIWMRERQKEATAVHKKQRESLRAREGKPFTSGAVKLTHRELTEEKERREEKRRVMYQKHYDQIVRDACSLAGDLFTSPPTVRTFKRSESSKVHLTTQAPRSEGDHRLADENPGHTELSDTAELLDELVREGYLSPADLDLSSSQPAHCNRLDQQQSRWMSKNQVLSEDERREVRIWMRERQKKTMAVHKKQRESLRARECKPFTSGPVKLTHRELTEEKERREEKRRVMYQKHYDQIVRDACSMAGDLFTGPPTVRTFKRSESSQVHLTTQAPRSEGDHRGAAVGKVIPREQMWVEEREELNRLDPTSELKRLLEPEESNIVLTGLLDEQDDGASEMDWLDNLSGKTGSILSKINWASIERMAAGEDSDSESTGSILSKIDWAAIERMAAGEDSDSEFHWMCKPPNRQFNLHAYF